MLRRQKGQGLVEFALIAPVLLLVILAIIEMALVFQGYLTVQHAAREAARWAVTYKPDQGQIDEDTPCDGQVCRLDESQEEYWRRRVGLIKEQAVDRAVGLRFDRDDVAFDEAEFQAQRSEPEFFGVQVWGFPSFVEPESGWHIDRDWWDPRGGGLRNHPGLPGLPVRVRVTHNVELLDPLFRSIIERVQVVGQAEMINEGSQPGFSREAAPTLPPSGVLPTVGAGTPIGPTEPPEPELTGTITTTPPSTVVFTTTLTPLPTDTPTVTPSGPFITLSNYQVLPTQVVLIDVNQHPPEFNPYELLWVDPNGAIVEVISPTLYVDDTGFKLDLPFTIPPGSAGIYYVETRKSGSFIARSAAIQLLPPPPDLVVSSIGQPTRLEPNSEVTLTVEVQNLTTGSVEGYFDVDLYVDPPSPPVTNRPGTSKQWVLGMGPLETKVITHVVTLYGGGLHELWAQVDTSNWVPDEGDETNNIFGPSSVTAASQECTDPDGNVLSDRFSEPGPDPDPKWRPAKIGDASVHETTVIEVDGTLSIEANGSGMWDGPDAGGTFLYQPAAGDFVATLKIIQGMSGGAEGPGEQFAKVGLMARASTSANSRWVSVMKARDGVQFGFRTSSRGERFANDAPVGSPVWVRLIRSGDSFAGFYSSDGASWVPGTGNGEDGGVTVDLGDNILIGIAALSASGNPAIAVVDDFEVCFIDADSEMCQDYSDDFEGESTAVWSDVDIGTTQPGSSDIDAGTMTVLGNGASLWESDNLHFTYQPVSGNFVATLKVNSGPGQDEWSKAGLMVRGSSAQDSAQVMVMKTRDYGIQFGYRETDGDPNRRFAADTRSSSRPVWVRIVRSGSGFSAFYSTDGANWTYGGSTTADLPGEVLVGLAVSSNTEQQLGRGNFDDFLYCAGDAGAIDPPTVPPEDKPPGLKECVQTIKLGNFEASVITPPWQRNVDAYHASDRKHSGNFSLEFRASVGPRPEYKHLRPWAQQAVDVPGDVLPDTTGTLSFWQLVVPDSEEGRPDPSDRFYLAIRDSAGVTQTADIPLAQGDTNTPVFQQKVISVETYLEGDRFAGFAAQQMQVAFYGVHNGQPPGTSFYIDDVRFDICTTQPIPEDVPGTASMGGLVEVLLRARPTKMPGIEVWAFARGGELYRTKTIHDSTYHFYNVPPGVYTIYAEVWMEGILYTSTQEVEVVANERNYAINMLLQ